MSRVQMNRFGVGMVLMLGLVVAALLTAGGCGKEETETQTAEGSGSAKAEQKLVVIVPCSIFAPFADVLDLYRAANPDVVFEFDSGNSVVQKRRILDKGEYADVYMGTGPLETNPLVDAGLVVDGSMRIVSSDTVIVTVPKGNPAGVGSVEDLFDERIGMIAMPQPDINSAGKFAIEAFKKMGVWEKIEGKVEYTELGRMARKYVMEGKVDAAIMYRSCLYEDLQPGEDVIASADIVTVTDLLKDAQMPEIGTPGVVLKASSNKELAQQFLDFLASPAARKEFDKWRMIQGGTLSGDPGLPEPASVQAEKEVILQAYYPFNEKHQYIADFVLSLSKKYGDSVKVEIIDFRDTSPGGGYDKWRATGLTCAGIFLNGEYSVDVEIDGEVKNIRLLRKPGTGWEKHELEAAVVQALAETKPED